MGSDRSSSCPCSLTLEETSTGSHCVRGDHKWRISRLIRRILQPAMAEKFHYKIWPFGVKMQSNIWWFFQGKKCVLWLGKTWYIEKTSLPRSNFAMPWWTGPVYVTIFKCKFSFMWLREINRCVEIVSAWKASGSRIGLWRWRHKQECDRAWTVWRRNGTQPWRRQERETEAPGQVHLHVNSRYLLKCLYECVARQDISDASLRLSTTPLFRNICGGIKTRIRTHST